MMENVLSAFRQGSQNWRIVNRLCFGPVDNGELIFKMRIGKYTGRLFECRKKIAKFGLDIKAERISNEHWRYRLERRT